MNMMRATTIGALAMGTLLAASAAAPAWADRDGWRHGDRDGWRRHGGWERGHRGPPAVFYAPRPRVVYAPPPVYYAPPPVYYAPPPVYYAPRPYVAPGVSLGIGFNLR